VAARTHGGLFIERTIWHDCLMTTITLQKAQLDLPVLIERALAGEEIVIVVDSRKVRLAPVAAPPVFDAATARRRGYSSMKGQFEFTDAFFEPLPEDELKFWEGRGALLLR
jgi:antitoxin (DNA-binding transcriptional repressor) of toxin-antitoxin stability system